MFLNGPAYDTWKNLTSEQKLKAEAIKNALRQKFGISRQRAWYRAKNINMDCFDNVNVISEEIRKNLKTVIGSHDPVEAITSMLLLDALPENLKTECQLRLDENFKLIDLQTTIKKKRS